MNKMKNKKQIPTQTGRFKSGKGHNNSQIPRNLVNNIPVQASNTPDLKNKILELLDKDEFHTLGDDIIIFDNGPMLKLIEASKVGERLKRVTLPPEHITLKINFEKGTFEQINPEDNE